MKSLIRALWLLSLAIALPSLAVAQPSSAAGSGSIPGSTPTPQAPGPYAGQRIEVVVDNGGTFEALVYDNRLTTINFPCQIRTLSRDMDLSKLTQHWAVGNKLQLQPKPVTDPTRIPARPRSAGIELQCNNVRFYLVVRMAEKAEDVIPGLWVVLRSEYEAREATIAARVQSAVAAHEARKKAKQEEEESPRIRAERQQRFHSFARNVQAAAFFDVARYGMTARYLDSWQRTPVAPVRTTGIRYTASGPQAIIFLEAANHSQTPQIIRKVKLTDIQKSTNPTRNVFIEGEAIPASIELHKTLQPGERTLLAVVFDNLAMDTYALQMTTQEQGEGAQPKASETWFIPIEEPKSPNEGRRTVYAKGLVGAIQLAENIDESMPGKLKTAFLGGYGARITYGFTEHVNVETELVYAQSGTASFGAVDRSASLLRIQFGGLLRFGNTYMPTLRAGLGLYGASQRRMVNGMVESKTDFDLSLTGGIGMDIRLSEGWVIGGALSLDDPLNSSSRTLEFAIHLGFGWMPKREAPAGFTPFGG